MVCLGSEVFLFSAQKCKFVLEFRPASSGQTAGTALMEETSVERCGKELGVEVAKSRWNC